MYGQNIGEFFKHLCKKIKKKSEGYLIIGEDLNARTGCEGSPIGTEELRDEQIRRSRDKMINKEKRMLIRKIRERG